MYVRWAAFWIIVSLLCFTVSGAGFYLVNCQAAMFGVYPQPLYTDTWNPIEIMKWFFKLMQPPEYVQPGVPSEPKQVPVPTSIDAVTNIYELVAYCNAHPDLVNKRIREASQQYGYNVPEVTCQVQLTTTGVSGTVQTTWWFSHGEFQKVEYGLKGEKTKAKIVGDENFIVSEVKFFLKGMFLQAKQRAEEEFGKKYRVTYYSLDPPIVNSVALGSILLMLFTSLALLASRRHIVFSSATVTYIAAAFIHTTPYGPPTLMLFAAITSLAAAKKPETKKKKHDERVERFIDFMVDFVTNVTK